MRYVTVALCAFAFSACGQKPAAEFVILGITPGATNVADVAKLYPELECQSHSFPSYKKCVIPKVDIYKITSSLYLDVDDRGVVTAATVIGDYIDGPYGHFMSAMNERYGPAHGAQGAYPMWRMSNGEAVISRLPGGGATISFHTPQWQLDFERAGPRPVPVPSFDGK